MTGMDLTDHRHKDGRLWSTEDCIDVTLIWLRLQRERINDAISKIEDIRPQKTPGA